MNKNQYINLEKGITRYLHKARTGFIVDKLRDIKKELNRPIRILDVGSGDGVVTKYISFTVDVGDNVFGVDNNNIRIKRAMSYCPEVQFLCSNAERLAFGNEHFDVVLLHHVIEHIEDDIAVLGECRRVLKKDGSFILGFPNDGSLIGKILRTFHKDLYSRSGHINFYSIESMRSLVEQNGFTIEELSKFGLLFPFYYIHLLLLKNKTTFNIGNALAQKFDALADSVILVMKKETAFI